MAVTWNEMTIEQLDFAIKKLKEAYDNASAIKQAVVENELPKIWADWSDSHGSYLASVARFAKTTLADMEDQAQAKVFGRKCRAQLEKEKAAKTTKRRVETGQRTPRKKAAKKKGTAQ